MYLQKETHGKKCAAVTGEASGAGFYLPTQNRYYFPV